MAEIAEELLIKLSADVTGIRAQMDEIAQVVKKDNEEIVQSTRSLGASFKSAMDTMLGFWGAMEAKRAVESLVDANIHMQQIQYTLEYATGSATAAATQMQFLANVSNSLGINLQEAGMQFARLLSAAQGQAITLPTLQSLYIGLAKTFDILHASTASQQRVMQTFTEMMTMGTIHAQQLRMMLGRDLPGVNFIGIAAKELGVTTEQLNALMAKGQLTAEQLMPALAKGLNDAADKGTALSDAINGTNAVLNRFHTAVFELENELANKFTPTAGAVIDQITQIAHALAPLDTKVKENKEDFSSWREATSALAETLLGLKAVVVTFFDLFKATIQTAVNMWVTFIQEIETGASVMNDAFHRNWAKMHQDVATMGSLGVVWAQNMKEAWVGAGEDIANEWSSTAAQIEKVAALGSSGTSSALPNVKGSQPSALTDTGAGLGVEGGGRGAPDLSKALDQYSTRFSSHFDSGSSSLTRSMEKDHRDAFKASIDAARHMAEAQSEYANQVRQQWMHAMDPVANAFGSAIDGIVRGTQTLQGAMRNMLQNIMLEYINMSIKMVEKWIAGEAAKTAATSLGETTRLGIKTAADKQGLLGSAMTIGKEIMMKMWNVMAGVYSAIAAIPYVGPFLAPAMAVAAGAEIANFASHVASAAGGYWDVPHDQMAMIHKQEMVLPAWGAQPLRDMLANGGSAGGGAHLHLHGVFDEGGMRSIFMGHSDALAEVIQHLVRTGGLATS